MVANAVTVPAKKPEATGVADCGTCTCLCARCGLEPATSSTAKAPPEAQAPSATTNVVWQWLLGEGHLPPYLSWSTVARLSSCCSGWWQLAGPGLVCKEKLWHRDVGFAERALAWRQLLLGGISLSRQSGPHQDPYEKLRERESRYDSGIRRDVSRTLPQEALFRERNGPGQEALFSILHALAIRLLDVGYCQGLNFIVATLIGVFPNDEAAAFQCALALLLRHSLSDLFRPKFSRLGFLVWQFDRVVEGYLPKVHAVLSRHGVNSEYYGMNWFLTLFAGDLDQTLVRRIWDRFLVAGWSVIVQVGLALLYTIQDALPLLDTCQTLTFLKQFTRTGRFEAETLLASASSFLVPHRMLSSLEAAYTWPHDAQLLIVKDLNADVVHWSVRPVLWVKPSRKHSGDCPHGEDLTPLPQAFRRSPPDPQGPTASASAGEVVEGQVLPFVLHNLDTGEQALIDDAWLQYTRQMGRRARQKAGPARARPHHHHHHHHRATAAATTNNNGNHQCSSASSLFASCTAETAPSGYKSTTAPAASRLSSQRGSGCRSAAAAAPAAGAAPAEGPQPEEKVSSCCAQPQPQPARSAAAGDVRAVAKGSYWTHSMQRQAARRLG